MPSEYPDPRTEYVQSPRKISIPKLAEKWKISKYTLESQQFKQGWTKERELFQKELKAKTKEKALDELSAFNIEVIKLNKKLIEGAEFAATKGGFDNAKQAADSIRESQKLIKTILGEEGGDQGPKITIEYSDGGKVTIGKGNKLQTDGASD